MGTMDDSTKKRYAGVVSATAAVFRDGKRCEPQATGLAADVEKILRQHQNPPARPEPVRYPVPEKPGVYKGYKADVALEIFVQLDETGQWWPYPYSFSGWRTGELSLFELTELPELKPDVPEIRNPELREAVKSLSDELLAHFPEITDPERAQSFALEYLRPQY